MDNKKKYPRCNGEPLDGIHRQEFDYWEDRFFSTLNTEDGLDDAARKRIAYNLAFMTITGSVRK